MKTADDETGDEAKGVFDTPGNIFSASARRCPWCRASTFTTHAGAGHIGWLVCMGCGRSLHETELTEPDWKSEGKE